ncbi:L,D-transpeptidase [bacterium]|nr:L,D-transpeptidase [bacterium]
MKQKHLVTALFTAGLAVSFSACSKTVKSDASYSQSGSILLSFQIPKTTEALDTAPLIGFAPTELQVTSSESTQEVTPIATISLSQKTISKSDSSSTIQLAEEIKLPVGRHVISSIEEKPLWTAPESYFVERLLEVPAPEERNLYGALGPKALKLESGELIHTANIANPEVSGIRVSTQQFEDLFAKTQAGAVIEVIN